MSRLVVFLGLFCGFLFGVALLVLNPWTPPPGVAGARANTYDWVPLESYGVKLDETALLNLPLSDSDGELGVMSQRKEHVSRVKSKTKVRIKRKEHVNKYISKPYFAFILEIGEKLME